MQLLSAFISTTQDYHHHNHHHVYKHHHHHHHDSVRLQPLLLPVACVCGDVYKTL